MIVWISGAYGAGKSTVAEALKEKLGNAYLYDAEEMGTRSGTITPLSTAA